MIVSAPAPTPHAPCTDQIVEGDGWYPDVSLAHFRAAQRMPGSVTDGRAREAILGAMVSAADALVDWRAGHEAAGKTALELIGDKWLGGETRALVLWRRAVYAFAAADLADTHSDIGATQAGRDRRDERAAASDELRRNAIVALRDLLGKGRSKVALI